MHMRAKNNMGILDLTHCLMTSMFQIRSADEPEWQTPCSKPLVWYSRNCGLWPAARADTSISRSRSWAGGWYRQLGLVGWFSGSDPLVGASADGSENGWVGVQNFKFSGYMTVCRLCMHDFCARASAPCKIFWFLLKFLLKKCYICRVRSKKSESMSA